MTGFSKTTLLAGLSVLLTGGVVLAQSAPVDSRTARGQLFDRNGGQVMVFEQDFLNAQQIAQLSATGGAIPYYGAVAMAPDEGMLSETNQAAGNHHSVEAAETAALTACNAARSGGRACVVVMHFLPDDYEAGRAIQLSQSATDAFRQFRRGRGEKAFAISPSTGSFAFEKGDGAGDAAISACSVGSGAGNAAATDCYTAIVD
ncbi:MAG: 5-aminolevulic acid synthase [Halocynthiibacter sp.]